MQIRKTSGLQQSRAVNLNTNNKTNSAMGAGNSALPIDQLDISVEAMALNKAGSSEIRTDKVNQIRAQIADGVYDTPEKMDAAVSRLFDEMG